MLKRYATKAWTLWVPLMLTLIAGIWLMLIGQRDTAWTVSQLGTVLTMFGNLIYIVVWDSRKAWPKSGSLDRLANVMTLTRHDRP